MALDNQEKSLYNSSRIRGWRDIVRLLVYSDLFGAPDDLDFSRGTRRSVIYGLMLLLMLFSVVAVVVEDLLIGPQPWISGPGVLAVVAISVTGIHLRLTGRILLPPVITLSITFFVVLAAIGIGRSHNTFLLFPMMIALAGLLPTMLAWLMGLGILASLMWIRQPNSDVMELSIMATLVATWVLSLGLMRLIAQQTDELADLALTDPLTGALNRRYLKPQTERNIADYRRYSRLSTLVMIDIDHFKAINDTLGHSEGDRALQNLVTLVEKRIRGVDMLYRLGGEEFVIMLAETGTSSATRVAEELRVRISEMSSDEPSKRFTVSMGVCDVTVATSAEDWLRQLDEALYRAKDRGRNCVEVVPSAMPQQTQIAERIPVWR
ncbi:diguanylate cyclase [Luminiphilus syltensis NOR5-1B]|uniref:diguanylate cyclase n=1 Tax=Luminiphilus syltensis NOR5-1B TaxID=565045 RepID=B8KUK1_9GAMM|nr:GGDEF domain-containing protein [Luminiphilus syltensis]EED35242.1 diguanylate cyclase [Luminiphilus syltensis NOR5-1B]